MDRRARIRLSLDLIDENRKLSTESWKLVQTYYLGSATMGADFDVEKRKKFLSEAAHALRRVLALELPWIFTQPEQKDERRGYIQLKNRWEELYGKLDDPETQKRIDNTVAWMARTTAPRRR